MAKVIDIYIESVENIKVVSEGEKYNLDIESNDIEGTGLSLNMTTMYTRINKDCFMVQYTTTTPGENICPYCGNFHKDEESALNCCSEPGHISEEEMCQELENDLEELDLDIYINDELFRAAKRD